MTTAAERRKDARRLRAADRKVERQAEHEEQFAAQLADPVLKRAAFAICKSVYRATGCACEKRPDMQVCSTMWSAARCARNVFIGG
jgi:hypothetical protein